MKQTLRIYLYTTLIIFIPFTLISFILAGISYFIQINNFTMNYLIEALSYLILIFSALFFTSRLNDKRVIHCIFYAFIYLIISLLLQLGELNLIHLILKPSLFIIVGLLKEKLRK